MENISYECNNQQNVLNMQMNECKMKENLEARNALSTKSKISTLFQGPVLLYIDKGAQFVAHNVPVI